MRAPLPTAGVPAARAHLVATPPVVAGQSSGLRYALACVSHHPVDDQDDADGPSVVFA